jgi:4-hydroxy-tetrahydrodipicolinate reductase
MGTDVDNSSTSIIVFGASGRMGSRIVALASTDRAFDIRAAIVRDDSPRAGEIAAPASANRSHAISLENAKNAEKTPLSAHVVIDFSSDAGAAESLAIAQRTGASLLVGTTALSDARMAALRHASSSRAILVAPNTSLGVALLSVLVRDACRALGADYHASIVEAHHSAKKDAPSGTALRLARSVRDAGHELRDDQILAMRGGDVVGEHTVRLAGPGEYIELTHRATTRDLFARGALRCAAWLKGRAPGWYTVQDVVGLPG